MLRILGAVAATAALLLAMLAGANFGESEAAFGARTASHPEVIRALAGVFNGLAQMAFLVIAVVAGGVTISCVSEAWYGRPNRLFAAPSIFVFIAGMFSTSEIWPRWLFLAGSAAASVVVGLLLVRTITVVNRESRQPSRSMAS